MARRAVPQAVDRYPPGALLVQRGHPITDQQFNLLRLETSAFSASQQRGDHFRRGIRGNAVRRPQQVQKIPDDAHPVTRLFSRWGSRPR